MTIRQPETWRMPLKDRSRRVGTMARLGKFSGVFAGNPDLMVSENLDWCEEAFEIFMLPWLLGLPWVL